MALSEKTAAEQRTWASARSVGDGVKLGWFTDAHPEGVYLKGKVTQKTGADATIQLLIQASFPDGSQHTLQFPPRDVKVCLMDVDNSVGNWQSLYDEHARRNQLTPFDPWEVTTWSMYLDVTPDENTQSKLRRLHDLNMTLRTHLRDFCTMTSEYYIPEGGQLTVDANRFLRLILVWAKRCHEIGSGENGWRSNATHLLMGDMIVAELATVYITKQKGSVLWFACDLDKGPIRGKVSQLVRTALTKKPGDKPPGNGY